MNAKSAAVRPSTKPDEKKNNFLQRLTWVCIVGIVPIVVAILVVGGALQFIGVPVLQTAGHLLGRAPSVTQENPMTVLQQTVTNEKHTIASLRRQLQSDAMKMKNQIRHQNTLNTEINRLQNELNVQATDEQQGSAEAKVLVQMDPSAAAKLVVKMSVAGAAWVVAGMSAAESAPILQLVPASTANQILNQAAIDEQREAGQQAQNATSNATPGTTP